MSGPPPPGFTVVQPIGDADAAVRPVTLGCSVWGCIAYDAKLNRLYCPTGNGVPDSGWARRPAGPTGC